MDNEDDPKWGPHTARFNLSVAVEAASGLQDEWFETEKVRWYWRFASAIIFSRAAIDALREADGKRNGALGKVWGDLFKSEVRDHPVFKSIIDAERHILAHGKLGVALNPYWPLDMVHRHGGLDAIFDDGPPRWPDGHFAGQHVNDVLTSVLTQVGRWIDAVDAESSKLTAK